jgi:hypothetical protein
VPPREPRGSLGVVRALKGWPVAALAGWAAFTAYIFAQALGGPVLVWNDSLVYRRMASVPTWSRNFWAGPRPPLTPLLLKLVGDGGGFLVAEAAIGALSWGVLAWSVGRVVMPGWRRVVATWLILAFASTWPVTLWSRSLLSEQLALSALALVFAACIWTVRQVTWPRIAVTGAACLVFAATRDAEVWTVALLGGSIAIVSAFRLGGNRRLLIRVGTLGLCLIAVAAVAAAGALSSHRAKEDIADVLYVRVFPFPSRVAWFSAHGMPEQHPIDTLAKVTPEPADGVKVVAPPSDRAFVPLHRWMGAQGAATYFEWLAAHPVYVLTEPLIRPERAFNYFNGDLSSYGPTQSPMRSPLTVLMWPPFIGMVGIVSGATYLSVLSGVWRVRTWRVVLLLTGLGVVAMFIAWHGDGQEVTRHTIEGQVEFRLGLWILALWGVLSHFGGMLDPGETPLTWDTSDLPRI